MSLLVGMVLIPGSVLAEVVSTPDLAAWISAWKKSPANPNVPKTLAIIDRWQSAGTDKASPHFGALEPKDCEAWTYLQCEGHGSLNFTVAINTAASGTFKDINAIRKLIQPDIFVLPADKGWQLQLRGNKENTPFKWMPNSGDSYARELTDTITKALRYDGIVLAQKDNFLLIGSTTEMLEKNDMQGLVLSYSEKSPTISDNSFTGSALISKISNQHGFGLFSLVASLPALEILPGTKVILEKKRVARANKPPKASPQPVPSSTPPAAAP